MKELQRGLVKLGYMTQAEYNTGPGIFGPRTNAALKEFQSAHGLAADGIYGPKSRAGLEKALTGKAESPKKSTPTPKDDYVKGSGSFPKVPRGRSGIESVFGKAGTHQTTVKLPLGPGGREVNVRCHEKLVPVMKAMLAEAKQKGLLKYIHTFDGMYNYRTKNHNPNSALSTHSWGISFDINASEGTKGRVNPQLAAVFEKYGFYWGKNFNDEMHFQYARGY
ncbi:MAG: peptidoglycan-binding protein [Myxococcales bacterium]